MTANEYGGQTTGSDGPHDRAPTFPRNAGAAIGLVAVPVMLGPGCMSTRDDVLG